MKMEGRTAMPSKYSGEDASLLRYNASPSPFDFWTVGKSQKSKRGGAGYVRLV